MPERDVALIGHTGFVGSTLAQAGEFAAAFNSANVEAIRYRRFSRVVCAGVSAVKWRANQNPAEDWTGIARLITCLEDVETSLFVLISTVDVYREPYGLTEADVPDPCRLHPYGRHRLALEEFVCTRFPNHLILRLPALFGPGLKKNALFDLLHGDQTEKIAPNAFFQWYPLCRLHADLDLLAEAGLKLVNIATEPISMAEIAARFFPEASLGPSAAMPARYDIRTLHDRVLGGGGGYHLNRAAVLSSMAAFLAAQPRS